MSKARYVNNDKTLRVRTVQRPVEVMERKCEHCGTWFEVDPRQAGRARTARRRRAGFVGIRRIGRGGGPEWQ